METFFEEGKVLGELHKMEDKINEEKSPQKKMNLQMEMLLKGMQMTQNPMYEF